MDRDAARGLVGEMDDFLQYEVDELADMLVKNTDTKLAFGIIVKLFDEITELIKEQDKGMITSLIREWIILFALNFYECKYTGDAFTASYENRLEDMKDKLRRAKQGLRDSVVISVWRRVINSGVSSVVHRM